VVPKIVETIRRGPERSENATVNCSKKRHLVRSN